MSAARRLHEAGRKFLLVTDRLGGRMYHSDDGTMNFGAIYISEDYKHVSRFVGRGQKLRVSEIYAKNSAKLLPLVHWSNLRYAFPLLRLVRLLRRFRKDLNQFRKEAEFVPQHEILPKYPFLQQLVHMSALQFIEKFKLGYFIEQFSRYSFATTWFAQIEETNAFFYLVALLPLIIKIYVADFSSTYEKLTNGFQSAIVYDKIKMLRRISEKSFTVTTFREKQFMAKNAIIAVPHHNAKLFYDVPKPHLAKPATVMYLRGKRRNEYKDKKFMMLDPEGASVVLIWQQRDNKDLLISLSPKPNLYEYYSDYEILGQVTWRTAMVISNSKWVPMKLEDNLFLAGDYNLSGLEDSYISGRCAANQIIGCSKTT